MANFNLITNKSNYNYFIVDNLQMLYHLNLKAQLFIIISMNKDMNVQRVLITFTRS